ncbi:MAG TPA: hypothetical protein VF713_17880 [Thermoanaerobaculia bacterium]
MANLSVIRGAGTKTSKKVEALSVAKLRAILEDERMRRREPKETFEAFEERLHAQLQEVEREVLAENLARGDVDAEAIVIAGTGYRRVLRDEETYMTAAGPVRVERALYKDRTDEGERAVVPMELNAGIVGGFWTPMAARQAAWVVAQLTPQMSEELFARVGNMRPSKSSLDRLAKLLAERWDDDKTQFEQALREAMVVPDEAVTVVASLDGVLAPMKDGEAVEKRAETAARGQIAKGPAGYREVGCATLSFCDREGKCLAAVRMARMPEPHKASLKRMLTAELAVAMAKRPDLRLVKAADGANDNWTFLHNDLPPGEEVVDFFHAAEHLSDALAAAYGDGSIEARRRFADLRHVLLEEEGGVGTVIRSLIYLRDKHPRSKRIATELAYFRKRRQRMRYAEMRAQGLPIGTGVTEAACKTLVTQRLKQSGMRWGHKGGQAILNLRGWAQSERFDQAWALLAATFHAEITLLNDVVSIQTRRS